MRARRVAILLALTALSALTLFLVSLMDPGAATAAPNTTFTGAAAPETLATYEEMVIVGPDGDARVELTVVIGRGGYGDLLLPFDFDDGGDFTILSGPADFRAGVDGAASPTTMVLGRRLLNLARRDSAAPGDTVRVAATVPGWYVADEARRPFGEFVLERGFVNYSVFVMREFRLGVTLAPGMTVHSIEKVVPGFDPKKSPQPPYSIDRHEGRARMILAASKLAPTDAVHMEINIRPERRGLIPLIGGIIAALLYLVFFRDVLKPKDVD